MSPYLSILASVLALSLTASALPHSAHNHAAATMSVSGMHTAVQEGRPAAVNNPRQIHNADYGSGGGPSGNPGSPPPQASSGPGPATPTSHGEENHTDSPTQPTDNDSGSTAGQKRGYFQDLSPTPAHAIY